MRQPFGLERGIRIFKENDDTSFVDIIHGLTVPGGDAAEQDEAPIGSLYLRSGTGMLFQKIASTNATSDWKQFTDTDLTTLSFRSEKVVAGTSQAAPSTGAVLDLTASPLTDDDAPLLTAASFSVNDHILFGIGGTPKLMRVSVVASPNITVVDAADPLSENDCMVVKNYLPDTPNDQEAQALVVFQGGAIAKIGDVNWAFATGINLSGAFSALVGLVVAGDSVEAAIAKLVGNTNALVSLSGVALGSTNLGTFPGSTIPDNQTTKQALAALELALENGGRSSVLGVTTLANIQTVLVDDVKAAKWYVFIRQQSSPANVRALEVFALHNGTPSADATAADSTIYSKLKRGANFNYEVQVDVAGAGAAQEMRLRVSSTEVGGVDVFVFREDIK